MWWWGGGVREAGLGIHRGQVIGAEEQKIVEVGAVKGRGLSKRE